MATDQKSISPWTMGRCQDILEGSPFLHDLELGSLERWRKRSSLLLLSLSLLTILCSFSNRFPVTSSRCKPSSTPWPIPRSTASQPSALESSPTGRVSLRCPRPLACSQVVILPIGWVESKSFYLLGSVNMLTSLFRKALCGAIVILLGGSIAEITASGWKSWLGAAVLVRFGVGLAQSILITYVSELTPFQIRGLMIGAYQLCLGIGQLISAIATQLITIHQPTKWRPLIATEFIFTGVCIYRYHCSVGN